MHTDHSHKNPSSSETAMEMEMLVWGNMRNYNFGLVRDNDDGLPLQPDIFSRMGSQITRAAIGPYHCLFLTESNGVFAVGNGKNGVLGEFYASNFMLRISNRMAFVG